MKRLVLSSWVVPAMAVALHLSATSVVADDPPPHSESESCLDGASSIVTVTGWQSSQFDESGFADGTAIDATRAIWHALDDTQMEIMDSVNLCFHNGLIAHNYPDDVTWDVAHSAHGMRLDNTPNVVVEGTRIINSGDGISIGAGTSDFTIRGVLIDNMHDDGIESDFLEGGIIEDTLLDGTYVSFAARPRTADSVDGSQNTWVIRNTLARLRPQIGVFKGPSPGHGPFFKWHERAPQLEIHDSVFRADQLPNHGDLGIPEGKLTSCSNNTMVWLGQGEYPEPLPECFTITTDISVWDNAVAQWRTEHGFNAWLLGDGNGDGVVNAADYTIWANNFGMTEVAIPGDYNINGRVEAGDFTLWANTFGETGGGLPADGNGNLVIDAADYTIWGDNFGMTEVAIPGDYNINGQVEAADYTLWANNFGQTEAAPLGATAAVPEPSTFVLSALGLIGLLAYDWRRRREYSR